jgi:hypothetical protein
VAETRPRADDLLTISEAARLTGLDGGGLKTQCQAGRINARKLGHAWVLTRGELHRYLMERERAQPRPLSPAYVAPAGMKGLLDEGRVTVLAARTTDDPAFVGYALARWQAAEQLSEPETARALGMRADDLTLLRLYQRPDPAYPSYADDLRTIAAHCGANPDVLDRVLRTYAP